MTSAYAAGIYLLGPGRWPRLRDLDQVRGWRLFRAASRLGAGSLRKTRSADSLESTVTNTSGRKRILATRNTTVPDEPAHDCRKQRGLSCRRRNGRAASHIGHSRRLCMRADHFPGRLVPFWGCGKHTKMLIISDECVVVPGKFPWQWYGIAYA
jgi:hypothetical protein